MEDRDYSCDKFEETSEADFDVLDSEIEANSELLNKKRKIAFLPLIIVFLISDIIFLILIAVLSTYDINDLAALSGRFFSDGSLPSVEQKLLKQQFIELEEKDRLLNSYFKLNKDLQVRVDILEKQKIHYQELVEQFYLSEMKRNKGLKDQKKANEPVSPKVYQDKDGVWRNH